MSLFKRKKKVIDLGERYRKKKDREEQMSSGSSASQETSGSATPFSFFDSSSSSRSSTSMGGSDSDFVDLSSSTGSQTDRRKRLAKRLVDMTTKIEDLSNQIYRIEQRIEVLERKTGTSGSFGPLE